MSIHACNIHCRTIDLDQAELLAMEDKGKWMPYIFLLDVVIGCKLSSDDEDDISYGCTTIFTEHGDSYVIDTPFTQFSKIFKEYYESSNSHSDGGGSGDFEL